MNALDTFVLALTMQLYSQGGLVYPPSQSDPGKPYFTYAINMSLHHTIKLTTCTVISPYPLAISMSIDFVRRLGEITAILDNLESESRMVTMVTPSYVQALDMVKLALIKDAYLSVLSPDADSRVEVRGAPIGRVYPFTDVVQGRVDNTKIMITTLKSLKSENVDMVTEINPDLMQLTMESIDKQAHQISASGQEYNPFMYLGKYMYGYASVTDQAVISDKVAELVTAHNNQIHFIRSLKSYLKQNMGYDKILLEDLESMRVDVQNIVSLINVNFDTILTQLRTEATEKQELVNIIVILDQLNNAKFAILQAGMVYQSAKEKYVTLFSALKAGAMGLVRTLMMTEGCEFDKVLDAQITNVGITVNGLKTSNQHSNCSNYPTQACVVRVAKWPTYVPGEDSMIETPFPAQFAMLTQVSGIDTVQWTNDLQISSGNVWEVKEGTTWQYSEAFTDCMVAHLLSKTSVACPAVVSKKMYTHVETLPAGLVITVPIHISCCGAPFAPGTYFVSQKEGCVCSNGIYLPPIPIAGDDKVLHLLPVMTGEILLEQVNIQDTRYKEIMKNYTLTQLPHLSSSIAKSRKALARMDLNLDFLLSTEVDDKIDPLEGIDYSSFNFLSYLGIDGLLGTILSYGTMALGGLIGILFICCCIKLGFRTVLVSLLYIPNLALASTEHEEVFGNITGNSTDYTNEAILGVQATVSAVIIVMMIANIYFLHSVVSRIRSSVSFMVAGYKILPSGCLCSISTRWVTGRVILQVRNQEIVLDVALEIAPLQGSDYQYNLLFPADVLITRSFQWKTLSWQVNVNLSESQISVTGASDIFSAEPSKPYYWASFRSCCAELPMIPPKNMKGRLVSVK